MLTRKNLVSTQHGDHYVLSMSTSPNVVPMGLTLIALGVILGALGHNITFVTCVITGVALMHTSMFDGPFSWNHKEITLFDHQENRIEQYMDKANKVVTM